MEAQWVMFTIGDIEYRAIAEYDDALDTWSVAEVEALDNAGDVRQIRVDVLADTSILALQDATNAIVGRHLRGELSAR